MHLGAERQCAGRVKFFGAMHREGIFRPAQQMRQHRHSGGIGAKMGVHMGDAFGIAPLQHITGFGQIDKMAAAAAF